MKLALAIFVLCLPGASGRAQCVTYIIGVNGDTLNCKDKDSLQQGKWVIHVDALRGEPGYEEEGVFIDGKKEGTWRIYDLQGDITGVENYRWGFKDGTQEYFTRMGDRLREENWRAVDPEHPYDTVTVYDDPHNPMKSERKVIKEDGNTVPHGTWTYFDPQTGTIQRTEQYVLGHLQSGFGSLDTPPSDTSSVAIPKEVQDYDKKNAGKKRIKVRTGETGG